MCGIFGAIGKGYNPAIVRALAIANRERGKHSFGMFSDYSVWKESGDPLYLMSEPDFNDWFNRRNGWFIVGHTRYATRGARTSKNAHPFRYGKYIGVHNGIVEAPKRYRVDSMMLWDKLNKSGGNYQRAWGDVSGYWGCAWYDGRAVWLQAHAQELAAAELGGTVYFSSDADHLIACLGRLDVWELGEGETWRFTKGAAVEQPALEARARPVKRDARTGGRAAPAPLPTYRDLTPSDIYPDWDDMLDWARWHGCEDADPDDIAQGYAQCHGLDVWREYVEEFE